MDKTDNPSVINRDKSFILSIVHSLWKNRSLSLVVELKIPEILCTSDKQSLSIQELAYKTDCTNWKQLYPVMRLLAQNGIGKELENRHFAKNEAMELLRRDKGPSLGHYVAYECSDEQFTALRRLPECVKYGKPAFEIDHDMLTFDYMYSVDKKPYKECKKFEGSSQHEIGSDERRREFAENYANYNAYFTDLATLPNEKGCVTLYNCFPWSECNILVDVGGSSGHFLASILKLPACEKTKGFVVDLPSAVDGAKKDFHELGVESHRLEFIKQDMTKSLPSNLRVQADTVIIKNFIIIFAKDEDLMASVLNNCLGFLSSSGGRVLIIEFCCPEGGDTMNNVGINGLEFNSQSIQRLSIGTSYVLSKSEWINILGKVGEKIGLKLKQVYDTFQGGNSIFELSYEHNK